MRQCVQLGRGRGQIRNGDGSVGRGDGLKEAVSRAGRIGIHHRRRQRSCSSGCSRRSAAVIEEVQLRLHSRRRKLRLLQQRVCRNGGQRGLRGRQRRRCRHRRRPGRGRRQRRQERRRGAGAGRAGQWAARRQRQTVALSPALLAVFGRRDGREHTSHAVSVTVRVQRHFW